MRSTGDLDQSACKSVCVWCLEELQRLSSPHWSIVNHYFVCNIADVHSKQYKLS